MVGVRRAAGLHVHHVPYRADPDHVAGNYVGCHVDGHDAVRDVGAMPWRGRRAQRER